MERVFPALWTRRGSPTSDLGSRPKGVLWFVVEKAHTTALVPLAQRRHHNPSPPLTPCKRHRSIGAKSSAPRNSYSGGSICGIEQPLVEVVRWMPFVFSRQI